MLKYNFDSLAKEISIVLADGRISPFELISVVLELVASLYDVSVSGGSSDAADKTSAVSLPDQELP